MSYMSAFNRFAGEPATGADTADLPALWRWLEAPFRALRGRRVIADLARLDDRMLRDIGLTRSDLRDAAAAPVQDDPTVVLFRRAKERRAARNEISTADRAVKIAERISREHHVPYY